MDLKERTIKGITWSAMEKWGNQTISFFIFVLLARLLEPESFGLVAMASVFIALISVFIEQGFAEAIIQRTNLEQEHLDTAFWTNVLMGAVMTLAGILLSKVVAYIYHEPQLVPIVTYLSLMFIFVALSSTQQAILRRNMDFKKLSIRSLIANVFGGITGITCAFLGFGVWSLVYLQLVSGVVGVLLLWHISDWRPKFRFSIKHFKEMFPFSLSMLGHRIVNFADTRTGDFIIGYFLGPIMLGYYRIAYRILEMINNLIMGVVAPVVLPVFSRLQEEKERLRQVFFQGSKLISIVVFPIFIGIVVLGPELITTLFGAKWKPSVPIVQILVFAGLLQTFLILNSTLIAALGRPGEVLKIRILSSIIIVSVFIIVVRWGIAAVALAYVLINYLIIAPLHFRLLFRLVGITEKKYLSQFGCAFAGTMIMLTVIYATKYAVSGWLSTYGQLFLYLITAASVYLVTIRFIWPKFFSYIGEYIYFSRR